MKAQRYFLERVGPPRRSIVDVEAASVFFGEQVEWGYAIAWVPQHFPLPRRRCQCRGRPLEGSVAG